MPVPKSDYVSNVWRDGIFDGKVVFCTGGAGSICSAQVRAMVHLGANACILGRNKEKTEAAARDMETVRKGSKVLGLSVDVRSVQSLEEAAKRCEEELGSIDYVIAGAAGNFLSSIDNLSANAFKTVIDIDLIGSYNTLKATIPYLKSSAKSYPTNGKDTPANGTGGRIIFVSATLHYTGTLMQTHASAAKAGVDSLSTHACLEFGPYGITSNVIAPGPIGGTEGMDRLSTSEMSVSMKKAIPSGRFGTVKEIADATVFLFSDAGNYVNGEIIVVDGGAWHRAGSAQSGGGLQYPEFIMSGEEVQGVKGMRKNKSNL